MPSKIITHLKILPQRLLAIIIFLLVWEIAVRSGMTSATPIPPASSVLYNMKDLAIKNIFWEHTFASMQRVFSGYLLAVIIAIPLGVMVGWYGTWEKYLSPLLHTIRQIPLLALFPLFILLFGIGELSRILAIMFSAMWWILLSTISAVKNVDPLLVKTARSMGASQSEIIRKVVMPSAVPSIFVSLRYAYTDVLLVLFAVEMLGAEEGWGVISGGHEHHGQNMVLMYPIIAFMTLIGVIINYVLVVFEKILCRWRERIEIA